MSETVVFPMPNLALNSFCVRLGYDSASLIKSHFCFKVKSVLALFGEGLGPSKRRFFLHLGVDIFIATEKVGIPNGHKTLKQNRFEVLCILLSVRLSVDLAKMGYSFSVNVCASGIHKKQL